MERIDLCNLSAFMHVLGPQARQSCRRSFPYSKERTVGH